MSGMKRRKQLLQGQHTDGRGVVSATHTKIFNMVGDVGKGGGFASVQDLRVNLRLLTHKTHGDKNRQTKCTGSRHHERSSASLSVRTQSLSGTTEGLRQQPKLGWGKFLVVKGIKSDSTSELSGD